MNPGLKLVLFLSVFISGCARTEYKPYSESEGSPIEMSRTVNFYVSPALGEGSSQCVLVLPPPEYNSSNFIGHIEKVLVRHLSDRFSFVVGGRARDARAANLAFDLTILADQMDFAEAIDCDSIFEYQILLPKYNYMLVWSEVRIGVEARLFRQRDGLDLWKARHVARRSAGGLSFSPFGLVVNAYDANAFSSDGDVVESVAEDLMRRLFKTMPNKGGTG